MNQRCSPSGGTKTSSLRYTGIEINLGLTYYGLYDTVVAREEAPPYGTTGR